MLLFADIDILHAYGDVCGHLELAVNEHFEVRKGDIIDGRNLGSERKRIYLALAINEFSRMHRVGGRKTRLISAALGHTSAT